MCGLYKYLEDASLSPSTQGNLFLQCLHPSLTNCKHVELKRWHKNIFMKFVIAYVVFEINLKNKGKHVCTRKASSINKLFALERKSVEALGEYLS